ncbi:unnamed protein product [Nesidiocoris tenuis]|uniref:Uncharacterized protein n=1 Tax=Nesidiocoris tenuis TaxID=355587 RepID=A0A6H5H7S9_9HEMI|nr:unnamed protein product [Nesidiocoris tenuis]
MPEVNRPSVDDILFPAVRPIHNKTGNTKVLQSAMNWVSIPNRKIPGRQSFLYPPMPRATFGEVSDHARYQGHTEVGRCS